jgi:hypothetical protein
VPDSTQNTNSSQNLKSSEQEYNFFFCFFLPTPPRGPCALASGIVALRVVPESKSLTSSSKQGGRRLFGANSTATHATPKSSEKEEVFVSSFSAHQWENQPPKKQKNKKTCKFVEFCTPIRSKKYLCDNLSYNQCCSGIRLCRYQEVFGINFLYLKFQVGF